GEELGAVGRQRTALGTDAQPGVVEPHLEPIAEADEGVASEALAALDALEQEARRERAELHERRDRRVEGTGDVGSGLQGSRLQESRRQQKPHPGVIRRWVSGAVKSL